jgi:hypothetical protein
MSLQRNIGAPASKKKVPEYREKSQNGDDDMDTPVTNIEELKKFIRNNPIETNKITFMVEFKAASINDLQSDPSLGVFKLPKKLINSILETLTRVYREKGLVAPKDSRNSPLGSLGTKTVIVPEMSIYQVSNPLPCSIGIRVKSGGGAKPLEQYFGTNGDSFSALMFKTSSSVTKYPVYALKQKVVDHIITNFYIPQSIEEIKDAVQSDNLFRIKNRDYIAIKPHSQLFKSIDSFVKSNPLLYQEYSDKDEFYGIKVLGPDSDVLIFVDLYKKASLNLADMGDAVNPIDLSRLSFEIFRADGQDWYDENNKESQEYFDDYRPSEKARMLSDANKVTFMVEMFCQQLGVQATK